MFPTGFGCLLTVLIALAFSSTAEAVSGRLPKACKLPARGAWAKDVGAVDTPVKALRTLQMCYALSQPIYCRAVGIKGQRFKRSAGEIGQLDRIDRYGTRIWVAFQKTLDASDIAALEGERRWARIGYVELAYLPLECGKDRGGSRCGGDYGHADCDRMAPPSKNEDYQGAYFRPVGAARRLTGWAAGSVDQRCCLDDPKLVFSLIDCGLEIFGDEESYRFLMERRHEPPGDDLEGTPWPG